MRFVLALILAIPGVLTGCVNPSTPTADPMPERKRNVLTASAYIKANYDSVWARFTRAAAYEAWYSAPCIEFGTQPGERVAWGHGDKIVYEGTLERIEKGKGLTHTFQFQGFGFEEPPSPVEIDIVEQGEVVLISIRHDCTDAPRTGEMISSVGWLKSLSRLKTLLETGRAMPWPEDG